jgi:hypothetical protein
MTMGGTFDEDDLIRVFGTLQDMHTHADNASGNLV